MRRTPRSRALLVALALLCAAGGRGVAADRAAAAGPVRVTASFDPGAVLGASTALDIELRLDPRRLTTAPMTTVRFAYPRQLGLVSSGLGLATCTRPDRDFAEVLVEAPRLGGCPANSVMGTGTALALVRLSDGQVIPEHATVTLLSGSIERGRLGLVVFVEGQRPFGATLVFAGEVRGAGAPYGGALTLRMPRIPRLEDIARVALVELRLTIGSHAIRYYEHRAGRRVAYHPDGIQLPAACPPRGFAFEADLRFADGTRELTTARTPCPPAVASTTSRR
jgi:hypothetical protein